METKEMMDGEKPTTADELSAPKHVASSAAKIPLPLTWEDKRTSSASQFFERLNLNQAQPEVQRDLTSSELLEFLGKQRSEAQLLKALSLTADGSSQDGSNKTQSMYNKDWNQEYQRVAIDQCDITSSVDYGSRDFYPLSTHTSGSSYIHMENELDDITGTDTRGNWWQGSFYY